MARNGSGIYTPPGADFPVVASTLISSTKFNNTVTDVASALTASVAANGETAITGSQPMAGFRHTGVGNAAARNEYAATGQVQDQTAIWCGTAGGTANALTLTPTPAITAYVAGQVFRFIAASATTGAVTVAVSGLATKAVQINTGAMVTGEIVAGLSYEIVYDGTAFQLSGRRISSTGVASSVVASDSAANIGVGAAAKAWGSTFQAVDVGNLGLEGHKTTNGINLTENCYHNGTDWRTKVTGASTALEVVSGALSYNVAASVAAGSIATMVQKFAIDAAGKVTAGSVPLTRMGAVVASGSSSIAAGGLLGLVMSSTANTHEYFDLSAYDGPGTGQVYIGWTPSGAYISTYIEKLTDTKMVIFNNTTAARTIHYKAYRLTET